jgi:hypothetical protein
MVKPLSIRGDRVPDDAVVVIRAGLMSPASVEQAASRTFDVYGLLGVSVEAAIDQTVLEACLAGSVGTHSGPPRPEFRRSDSKPGAWA